MQPRTLEQIISELNPTFQAQTSAIQQQQSLIPQQIQSQEQALNAQKDVAYEDIVSGARRRGLGFSGIPLGEQAKYAATQYAPALAGLRQQGQQQALTLQQALLGINERRDTLAQQIYQTEQDRAFQASEAEKSRRAAASNAFMPTFSQLSGQTQQQTQAQTGPRVVQSKPGSFAFYGGDNKPITAAQYAKQTGNDIRDVLYEMGTAGDQQAARAYNLLRGATGAASFNSTIAQLAKASPWLLHGYATPTSFNSPTTTQTASPAVRGATTSNGVVRPNTNMLMIGGR